MMQTTSLLPRLLTIAAALTLFVGSTGSLIAKDYGKGSWVDVVDGTSYTAPTLDAALLARQEAIDWSNEYAWWLGKMFAPNSDLFAYALELQEQYETAIVYGDMWIAATANLPEGKPAHRSYHALAIEYYVYALELKIEAAETAALAYYEVRRARRTDVRSRK